MRLIRAVPLYALLLASSAFAQTSPNLTYGQVPTAGQWNSYFTMKQDVLGFTPLNAAGGTMSGPLFLLPSTTSVTGLNVGVGAAPTFPNNGDMWETGTGLFARINGSTVNISTGGALPIAFPATVSGTTSSGGVPYFSSTVAMSSSATLGAGLLVKGGGAGVAPSTFTLGGGCTFATPNITCSAGSLSGATLASNVLATSITSTGALTGGSTAAGFTINLGTSTVSGTLPVGNSEALTGDVTKSAGFSATTVAKVQGTSVGAPTGTAGTAVVLGTTPTINQLNWVGDTTAATNPAAGSVGETLSAGPTTSGALTISAATTVLSKSITAGHWLCSGTDQFNQTGQTSGNGLFLYDVSLSLTNNVGGSPPADVRNQSLNTFNTIVIASTGSARFDFTVTTTIYNVVTVNFGNGAVTATGTIQCTRIW